MRRARFGAAIAVLFAVLVPPQEAWSLAMARDLEARHWLGDYLPLLGFAWHQGW
ncbi:MAG: hypothetical protein M3396_06390 [Actinomycetota bacterium]|nr:hypothetical protein [Actinomycetota bacterium]